MARPPPHQAETSLLTKVLRRIASADPADNSEVAAQMFNAVLKRHDLAPADIVVMVNRENHPAAESVQSLLRDIREPLERTRDQLVAENDALREENTRLLDFIRTAHGEDTVKGLRAKRHVRQWEEFEQLLCSRVFGTLALPDNWQAVVTHKFAVPEATLTRWRTGRATIPVDLMRNLHDMLSYDFMFGHKPPRRKAKTGGTGKTAKKRAPRTKRAKPTEPHQASAAPSLTLL